MGMFMKWYYLKLIVRVSIKVVQNKEEEEEEEEEEERKRSLYKTMCECGM